jgi:MFS family permease
MERALLTMTFIGVVCGMTLRTASAFKEVGSSWTFMALLAMAFSIGRGMSSLFSGEATKRYGSKVTALGFAALGTAGLGYAFGPPTLYPMIRIIHGISSGITWPSMQAVVLALSPPQKRARVSSMYFFIGSLGMSVAYIIGSAFSAKALYVAPFVLYVLSLYTLRISGKIGRVEKKREKGVFAPPSSTLFLMAMTTGMINVIVNTEVTIAYLYSILGKLGAGVALSFASAAGTLISYVLGKELLDI